MNRIWIMLLPLLLLPVVMIAAPPTYKVETAGACSSPDVSDAIKGVLQPDGLRVTADGGILCDVWLRKVLPMQPGTAAPDYGSLTSGEFVGVIIYAKGAGDFKGQKLKPGTYTMRYQKMPADGNHMGVSPTQEYFLLAPASLDKDPNAAIEYEPLVEMSRKVSGSNHPTPLYLVSPAGPSLAFRDAGDGRWSLEMKTKGQSTGGTEVDFPISLVLIGKGEG